MKTETHAVSPTGGDALATVATEHILVRLKEALGLAERDLPGNLPRFRELLEEVSDQTDAWILTSVVGGELEPEQPVSRVEYSMLSQPGGEPLDEFLLVPFGEVQVERAAAGTSFVFESKHADSARRWFERMGRKLAIDYEHQSFDRYNTRPDGLRPAAGWIGRLEVRDDGLWACEVSWTDRAKELLRAGEYRYFSPVIYWTDGDYTDVAGLGPVALTNDPAMRGVRPLAASRREPDERLPEEDAPEEASADTVLQAEIAALNQQIELLQTQMATQEADAFVERGMRLGKIVDSTGDDWREDYLRDPERAQTRLQRSPVLLPPGRVLKVGPRGEVVSGSKAGSHSKFGGEVSQHGTVEAEDLAAYDRALAAGRILHFAASPHA